MSDAITELRRLREWVEQQLATGPMMMDRIDARISALEAAQQAEPSRGDAKLRDAAQACVDHSYMKHQDPEVSIPKGYFDDLRAALGES